MTFDRRMLLRGLLGGAAGIALAPSIFAEPGPPPGKIALRFNENPYGPSARALKAAADAAAMGAYYPDTLQGDLLGVIAGQHGLARDNMLLSSGSNEALQAAFVAWGRKGKVLVPELSYEDHLAYARRMGVELVTVPMTADLDIDLDAMAAAVDEDISLVYICNPNNPTGKLLDGDKLRAFCKTVGDRSVVIVDEAYNEITDDPAYSSMVDLVREGKNVVVMRTFSKIFGMAGLRVGYGMARPDLAATISGHVMAWPNSVGMAAALASYTDGDFIAYSRGKILEGRRMVFETFRRNGIEPLPSQANFVFADIGGNGAEFQQRMAERDILIRGRFPKAPTYIRVSMGRLEDLGRFDEVFSDVYRG